MLGGRSGNYSPVRMVEKMKKYSLDELFPYEIQEEITRKMLILDYEIAEDEEVRQACKIVLDYIRVPGDDCDGIFD